MPEPFVYAPTENIGAALGFAFLAQSGSRWTWFTISLSVAGLIALIIVMVLVVLVLRRKLLDGASDLDRGEGFTLEELKSLRDRGRISSMEYDRAVRILASMETTHSDKPVGSR